MATRGGQGQSPFMAAVLGPDLLERQYRMASQQALAQQLSQRGSEPLQGQMVSGHYVAPSWTQQLGRLLDTGMGAKLQSDMPENMANLQRDEQSQVASAFGLGGGSQPDPQALALALGAESGSPGPTNGNAQRLAAGLSGQPQMPMLPGRSPQESLQAFQALGPQEYMKQVAQQGSPTDIQKNLIAQGIQPGSPQWNQALGATTEKAGYIAPVSASPGATLLDPRTNQPVFSAPQNGIQTQYGPGGQATASQVPGFAGAQADIAGAEAAATEAARAGMDLVDVPDGQGGTIKMPRSQAVAQLGQSASSAQPVAPFQTEPAQGQAASGGLGVKLPESVVAARQELPKVINQADQIIGSIDGILSHPGLSGAVGAQYGMAYIPGTEERDFVARSDQLQGQAFLQAFESLKGGGAITEIEGQAATNAIGRLSRAQSESAYKEALNELRGIMVKAKNRSYEKARMQEKSGSSGSWGDTTDRSGQLDSILGF